MTPIKSWWAWPRCRCCSASTRRLILPDTRGSGCRRTDKRSKPHPEEPSGTVEVLEKPKASINKDSSKDVRGRCRNWEQAGSEKQSTELCSIPDTKQGPVARAGVGSWGLYGSGQTGDQAGNKACKAPQGRTRGQQSGKSQSCTDEAVCPAQPLS